MNKEDFDNDEPIHHSEGKVDIDACPNSLPLAPPFAISRPCRMKRIFHRLFPFKKLRFHQANIIHYNINKLTLKVSEEIINNKQTKDCMINNINAFYCVIMNSDNNNDKKDQSNEKESKEETDDADHTEVVEVQPTSAKKPVVKQCDVNKDYNKSPLIPYMTYPQHAQYLIEWLHRNMDNQKNLREKLKAFRSVSEKGLFRGEISYDLFIEEFGYELSQGYYSKLMKSKSIYDDDELTLAISSLNMKLFY